MIRYHPQWLTARELVRAGRIGELRAVQVVFSYFNDDPEQRAQQADIGGGAALRHRLLRHRLGRYLFGAEPVRVVWLFERDPSFGTDRLRARCSTSAGRHLSFTVGTQCVPYQRVQLCGTKGRIEIQIPFNAPPTAPPASSSTTARRWTAAASP